MTADGMSNWTKATKPDDLKCPHCGEEKLIERIGKIKWRCDCCSKEWTAV